VRSVRRTTCNRRQRFVVLALNSLITEVAHKRVVPMTGITLHSLPPLPEVSPALDQQAFDF
jgi:hypothetical protein